ncbi:helix-turn-helix transcriptional regulator [Leucobacter sp. CSA1]|uniref:Helix-turn-helix transcriptional regulator n=1 Tax=Leucobacter chromiisoli TaxID=2796471 RepID=A0A934Q9Z1_9MICO|nr:helix-turn-helix transcriptional regulator [Leucobacter chromiisoli]MBK0419995.1 helix-turn-helix transcriptional regulator [Leucobacter chromiisoli]
MSTTSPRQPAESKNSMDFEVGRRIHMLMWDRGITQTALAPRVGINQSSLAKKLRGQRGWSLDDVRAVAAELQTTVGYLFGETENPHQSPDGGTNRRPTD